MDCYRSHGAYGPRLIAAIKESVRIEVGCIGKYLVRGARARTSRNSQRPHEQWKKGSKTRIIVVVDRFDSCSTYRESILRTGRTRQTCEEYDQQGDPAIREADTKPSAERRQKFGRWVAFALTEAPPEHREQRWGQEWSAWWQWGSSSGQRRDWWQR